MKLELPHEDIHILVSLEILVIVCNHKSESWNKIKQILQFLLYTTQLCSYGNFIVPLLEVEVTAVNK